MEPEDIIRLKERAIDIESQEHIENRQERLLAELNRILKNRTAISSANNITMLKKMIVLANS